MRRNLLVWTFVVAALLTIRSLAIADTMSSSSMKNKGSSMDWLIGTWTCVSKVSAMPKVPAHTETDMMTFQRVMNGMWMSQTYTGKGFSFQSYWRWDKPTKMLISVSVDSFGGYGTESSKGMHGGNSMTMSGMMNYNGQSSAVLDLITKMSDTKLRHVGKYQMNGKWIQGDDTVCTKNS